MVDREKVIYDIERCICHVPDACRDCSHYGHGEVIGCMEELLKDALTLLKEQEAVDPICQIIFDVPYYFCGSCKTMLNMYAVKAKYCSNCARRVKWK